MILMITPLIACRNHVVSAEQLKVSHQEDVVPIGNYIDENIHMKLEDGGAFSEKICVSADDEKIIGEIDILYTGSRRYSSRYFKHVRYGK